MVPCYLEYKKNENDLGNGNKNESLETYAE
jgi:hypothetical protein